MPKIGVTAEDIRTLAEAAKHRGTQDNFIDLAVDWANDAEKYITHLAKLLADAGVECICEGVDPLNPDCPLHGEGEFEKPVRSK